MSASQENMTMCSATFITFHEHEYYSYYSGYK